MKGKNILIVCLTALTTMVYTEPETSSSPAELTPTSTYKERSAHQIYKLLDKKVSFLISSKYHTQKYLHANYFVTYKKRPRTELADPVNGRDRFDGYLTFVVIGERGIYLTKIQERWIDLNTSKIEEQTEMKPLKELPFDRSRIVSFQMNSNETIFSVGYSNFTIEVFEIQEEATSKIFGYKLQRISSFNLRYEKIVEKDDQIRSIGITPYSDFLIASPNRFELFKLNRRTGKVEKKIKALLDSTGFVVCPVATFRHKDNPHSPSRVQRPWMSDKNFQIGTKPRCVMTGYSGPANVVIDWTTMQPVSFWNLGMMGGYPISSDNIIKSIDFFGGIPEPSLFVFSTSRAEYYIYAFDTISNRHIHKYFEYQKAGPKVVKWINGTLYVSVYIADPTSNFPAGSQLIFLKFFGGRAKRVYNQAVKQMNDREIDNYAISKVYLEMGAGDELETDDDFDNLDVMHLGYYILSNNLHIEAPVISWGHCFGKEVQKISENAKERNDGRMLYGRFRLCGKCVRGFARVKTPENPKELEALYNTNKTYITCQRVLCSADKKFNTPRNLTVTFVIERNRNLHGFVLSKLPKKAENPIEDCQGRYQLQKSEEGFANNDGCLPGYNRDYFGVCRNCVSFEVPYISNCFIFSPETIISEDYTLGIESYQASLFAKEFPFKGHQDKLWEQDKYTYQSVYFWDKNNLKTVGVSIDTRTGVSVWKHQQLPGSELCYRLDSDPSDPEGYTVLPARGFRLEPMKKFPWIDVEKQRFKYPNGSLNNKICVKDCEVGTYYDFKSLSCRRCGVGCAECHKPGVCEICIPGYLPVKKPMYRALENGVEVGSCRIGCQNGFFRRRFNGNCSECPKDCEVCRDRSKAEELTKEETAEQGSSGFCVICNLPQSGQKSKIVDEFTGKCVDSCDGSGMVITTRNTTRFGGENEYEYQVCSRCYHTRCKTCSSTKPNGCTKCANSYHLETNDEDGSVQCLKFHQLKAFRNFSLISFGVCSFLVVSFLFCWIKLSSKSVKKLKKRKGLVGEKTGKKVGLIKTIRLQEKEVVRTVGIEDSCLVDDCEHVGDQEPPFERMSSLKIDIGGLGVRSGFVQKKWGKTGAKGLEEKNGIDLARIEVERLVEGGGDFGNVSDVVLKRIKALEAEVRRIEPLEAEVKRLRAQVLKD